MTHQIPCAGCKSWGDVSCFCKHCMCGRSSNCDCHCCEHGYDGMPAFLSQVAIVHTTLAEIVADANLKHDMPSDLVEELRRRIELKYPGEPYD